LERASLEIKNDALETEKDKLKMKNDLMIARISLEEFKNAVTKFQAQMEAAQIGYDVKKSDYSSVLTAFITELNDAFHDTEISFDTNLSLMEETEKEKLALEKNSGEWTLEKWRAVLYRAYKESMYGFTACTITENAAFETDAATTLRLIHNIS
jgi:hypothetical protein